MTATLYLLRHGESEWNAERRVTGRADPALAAAGWAQAERLATVLAPVPVAAIFTSTLRRSIDTASRLAAAHRLEVRALAALDEQGFGILEGRHRDARDPQAAELWARRQQADETYALPGGESFAALRARVTQAVAELLDSAARGPVVIVGHRHTNRALLCALLGWSFLQARGAAIRHHFVHRIELATLRRVHTISLRPRELGRVRTGLWL